MIVSHGTHRTTAHTQTTKCYLALYSMWFSSWLSVFHPKIFHDIVFFFLFCSLSRFQHVPNNNAHTQNRLLFFSHSTEIGLILWINGHICVIMSDESMLVIWDMRQHSVWQRHLERKPNIGNILKEFAPAWTGQYYNTKCINTQKEERINYETCSELSSEDLSNIQNML